MIKPCASAFTSALLLLACAVQVSAKFSLNPDLCYDVASDVEGSMYPAGVMRGNIDPSPLPYWQWGIRTAWVAKVDSSGQHVWGKSLNTSNGNAKSLFSTVIYHNGIVIAGGYCEAGDRNDEIAVLGGSLNCSSKFSRGGVVEILVAYNASTGEQNWIMTLPVDNTLPSQQNEFAVRRLRMIDTDKILVASENEDTYSRYIKYSIIDTSGNLIPFYDTDDVSQSGTMVNNSVIELCPLVNSVSNCVAQSLEGVLMDTYNNEVYVIATFPNGSNTDSLMAMRMDYASNGFEIKWTWTLNSVVSNAGDGVSFRDVAVGKGGLYTTVYSKNLNMFGSTGTVGPYSNTRAWVLKVSRNGTFEAAINRTGLDLDNTNAYDVIVIEPSDENSDVLFTFGRTTFYTVRLDKNIDQQVWLESGLDPLSELSRRVTSTMANGQYVVMGHNYIEPRINIYNDQTQVGGNIDFGRWYFTGSPTTRSPSQASQAPSGAPSAAPVTLAPTATNHPTTISPSISPTTTAPTGSPSISPTLAPSYSPVTAAPTGTPSTGSPSISPTLAPSSTPTTASPTGTPSASPLTDSPTGTPSSTPTTASPTGTPSSSPTCTPSTLSPLTVAPSVSPVTTTPTAGPTDSPSMTPTGSPSTSPTLTPTTLAPTTASPSTISPTMSPSTISPTESPSTISPTGMPSITPGAKAMLRGRFVTDYDSLIGDAGRLASFKRMLRTAAAYSARCNPAQVNIISIRRGSVVVEVEVPFRSTECNSIFSLQSGFNTTEFPPDCSASAFSFVGIDEEEEEDDEKWVIPVAVVLSVIGCCCLAAAGYFCRNCFNVQKNEEQEPVQMASVASLQIISGKNTMNAI
eukprot:jgi/Bigna1/84236/fgenesh1_pg.127_\